MHTERLPSLAGLTVLEAVGRLGTVVRAAEELGLSQPAASRRLLALEADLGVSLLDRRHRPLVLTQHGRELNAAVRSSLEQIGAAARRLRQTPRAELTISAGAGFSAYWLIPRLAQMQAAFPDQALSIISQSHDREADRRGDLQVRFGRPDGEPGRTVPLFAEQVIAVASPLLLGTQRHPGRLTMDDFGRWPLLDMQVTRQPWFDWPTWLAALGAPPPRSGQIVRFDSYPLVVAATLAGQGIGLAWRGLLDSFLDSGALRQLGGCAAASERGYFMTFAPGLPADHPAFAVADWIVAQTRPDS